MHKIALKQQIAGDNRASKGRQSEDNITPECKHRKR